MTSSSNSLPAMEGGKTNLIVIGMAGSGKSTFMQRITSHLHMRAAQRKREPERYSPAECRPPYTLNLDPAVRHLPFHANIDIRQTVDYASVMREYGLGPNGAIMTCLNLFTTKFDQVLGILDTKDVPYVLVDTPGQIESFTWSACGSIICDTLAASAPTVIAYVVDTPRSTSPATFMSNMLYAVSILYKTKLPFILVFNKTDVVSHQFAVEWMTDFDAFQAALEEDTTYMGTLVQSMCLVLEEFYNSLNVVGVSAMSGEGIDEFFDKVQLAVEEYKSDYLPHLQAMSAKREANAAARQAKELEAMVQGTLALKVDKEDVPAAESAAGDDGDKAEGAGSGRE